MNEQKRSKLGDRIGQFVAVPVAFINDATVSPRAFRLFVVLRSYTSTNNADDMVFPGYETLRAKCGFSNFRYIAEAIRELEATGWIERKRQFGRSTRYWLNPTPVLPTGVVMEAAASPTPVGRISPTPVGSTVLPTGVGYPEVPNKNQKEQEVGGAPPAPLVSVKGFGKVYTSHPDARVAAYLDIMGQPHITASNAQIILDRVALDFVEVWRNVLTLWASSAWNPRNISGMIERYEGDKNAKRFPKAASAVKIGDWTPAKGMYPQVPDKPQPPPAPRKATMFGIEIPDVVTIVDGVEVPF